MHAHVVTTVISAFVGNSTIAGGDRAEVWAVVEECAGMVLARLAEAGFKLLLLHWDEEQASLCTCFSGAVCFLQIPGKTL